MRLIDAEELTEMAWRERVDTRERIVNLIARQPTIKAKPMKRGRWLPAKDWFMSKCSECGYELGMVLAAGYICCPKCAARMDGDKE